MTITEAKQLTYSNNPIVIKAESDQLPTFDGSYFLAVLLFGEFGNVAVGNGITFDGILFVKVSTESEESETKFTGNNTGFVDTFNSNADVNKRFFAYVSGQNVTIKALYKGSSLNIYVIGNNQIPTDLLQVDSTESGTDSFYGDTKVDYGVYLEVYQGFISDFLNITDPEKNNFIKVSDLLINYRLDNVYDFNLSGILRTYLRKELPDMSLTNVQRVGNQIGYYTRVGEVYKVNDTYRKRAFNKETGTAGVILGAVDLLAENNALIHITGVPLIEADLKPVYRDKGEYLYSFLKGVSGIAGVMNVKFTYYFYDGTNLTQTVRTLPLTAQNGVYYLKFNTSFLNISSLETTQGAEIEFFTIKVDATVGGDYTNEVRYKLFDCPRELINIGFRNKNGVIDLYSFVGKKEEETKGKIRTFKAFYPLNPTKTDKNLAVLTNEQRKEFVYNSGHLNENEFNSLLDLVKSKEVYVLENGEFTYIVPTGYSYSFNSDTDLYTISLQAVRTILENSL